VRDLSEIKSHSFQYFLISRLTGHQEGQQDGHTHLLILENEEKNLCCEYQVARGQAPQMIVAELEMVPDLSRPSVTCMYHAYLQSAHGDQEGETEGTVIADIAIMNPTATEVQFPAASTVVIGVNEIMPLVDGDGAETAGAGGEQHQH
jgi:hypothetical protein